MGVSQEIRYTRSAGGGTIENTNVIARSDMTRATNLEAYNANDIHEFTWAVNCCT